MVENFRVVSAPKGVKLHTHDFTGIKASLVCTTFWSQAFGAFVFLLAMLINFSLLMSGHISFEIFILGVLVAAFIGGALSRKRMFISIDRYYVFLDDKQYDRRYWGGFSLGHSETVVQSRRSFGNTYEATAHTKHRIGYWYGEQPHEIPRWFHQKNIVQIVDWLNAQSA